jgi:hypothetical protein
VRAIAEAVETWRARLPDVEPRRAALLSLAVCLIPVVFVLVVPHPLEQPFGVDRDLYLTVTRRWLDGGSYFEPYQLAGPYEIRAGDVLYPPVALVLFVPFALAGALGAVLWFVIPLAGTAVAVAWLRPRPIVWPLLALGATNPTTLLKVWTGNPVIWSMLALAVATIGSRWRFAAPFALLKPSLAPFALFGINRRSWWLGAAALVLASLPFGSLWAAWVASVLNSRGGGPLYSALEVPMVLLPLVAWFGRTRAG